MLVNAQFIHLLVHCKALNKKFYITIIYASNLAMDRLVLWDQLLEMAGQEAWFVAGDFNNVLKPELREGGSIPQVQEYGSFAAYIEDCWPRGYGQQGQTIYLFEWHYQVQNRQIFCQFTMDCGVSTH